MEVSIIHNAVNTRVVVVSRPPPSNKVRAPFSTFLQEFADLLDCVAVSNGRLIMQGDFIIHWDVVDDPETVKFSDLLKSHNLHQMVTFPTHISGHTIDFVITRTSESVVQSVVPSEWITDHVSTHTVLDFQKPLKKRTKLQCRKIKAIDRDAFKQDILNSPLVLNPDTALDASVDQYDSQLGSLLDKHAPLQSLSIVVRPVVPWYNEDIDAAKRERRQLERQSC